VVIVFVGKGADEQADTAALLVSNILPYLVCWSVEAVLRLASCIAAELLQLLFC
jgi:hypothetical protein